MRFADIAGQRELINRTVKNVKVSRVAHAQMIIGHEGSGGLAFALAYAQFVNCTDKQYYTEDSEIHGDSCGKCYSCVKSQKLIHPDIHFVLPLTTTKKFPKKVLSKEFLPDWRNFIFENSAYVNLNQWYDYIEVENKQGIISAEECNEILSTLSYKTYESEYKIMIIWMIEKLFHSAAPKLLKILEEPPEKTLFLLVSDNHHLVLDTIMSRVQLLKLNRLTYSEIYNYLNSKYSVEKSKVVKYTDMLNSNLDEIRETVLNDQDKDEFIKFFIEWMRTCYRVQTDVILSQSNTFKDFGRERQKQFLSFSSKQIRNAYVSRFSKMLLQYHDSEKIDFYTNFGNYLNINNIEKISEEIDNAINAVERNGTAKILFTHLSFKLGQYLKTK